MPKICLYFQVHQPFRLRNYSFFDIGKDHYYYDDYLNSSICQKVAENCYLPTNALLLKQLKKLGPKFKVAFSISGVALKQFELYAPEVIESFQALAKTGQVEFLAETYSHSLSSQYHDDLFKKQVQEHKQKIKQLFKQEPGVFRNTELIYNNHLGDIIQKMGFKGMLTEGAKHVLGWKSPNFLYYNPENEKLKLLLRNFKLSDDIAFRFSNQGWSEYPLTAEKYTEWLNDLDSNDELVNLFLDYETFGEHQWADTGIFKFLEELPETILNNTSFEFETPSEIIAKLQPKAPAQIPNTISWADEERDLTAWLGNDMQQEAFNKLYKLAPKIEQITHTDLLLDWEFLQSSDHFYYMSTKWFSDGDVHAYFNPYPTPYEAFINYMNVLSDFAIRVNHLVPDNADNKTIDKLNETIAKQQAEINRLKKQNKKLKGSLKN